MLQLGLGAGELPPFWAFKAHAPMNRARTKRMAYKPVLVFITIEF